MASLIGSTQVSSTSDQPHSSDSIGQWTMFISTNGKFLNILEVQGYQKPPWPIPVKAWRWRCWRARTGCKEECLRPKTSFFQREIWYDGRQQNRSKKYSLLIFFFINCLTDNLANIVLGPKTLAVWMLLCANQLRAFPILFQQRAVRPDRLEICQKFYTTIFLDRNFYTIKTRTSGLFSPTVNQRKCINISYLVLFCVKIYMNV